MSPLGAPGRLVVREARYVLRAALLFYEQHGFTSAAAAAFWGLLTMIPFALVLSGLFGLFVDWLGGPDDDALVREIVTGLRRFFPRLDPEVARYVRRLVVDGSTLSLGGIPLFFLMSSALLGTLEHAIGGIFHPAQKRTVARSTLLSLVFVVAVLFTLVAAVLAGMALVRLAGPFGATVGECLRAPWLAPLLVAGFGVLGFTVLVRSFAIVRIPRWDLVYGGVVFSLFWMLARAGFTLYLETIAAYDLVYGSLAVLVVLLLWLYYTATLFLVAAAWVQVRRLGHRPEGGGGVGSGGADAPASDGGPGEVSLRGEGD